MALNAVIEGSQIANHSVLVDLPADSDLQNVVMPVAVWVVALPVSGTILSIGHQAAVETMRCREAVTAIKIRLHAGALVRVMGAQESSGSRKNSTPPGFLSCQASFLSIKIDE